MLTNMATEREWTQYWSARDQNGAGDAVANDPGLQSRWRSFFSGLSDRATALDIACGAGGAMRHRLGAGLSVGVDLAPAALKGFAEAIGKGAPVCSPSDTLPFVDGAFHGVVSQFGVEYGGRSAFIEAARVLAPSGQLMLVVHYKDGSIAKESEALLREIVVLETEPSFAPATRNFFERIFDIKRRKGDTPDARAAFMSAQNKFRSALERTRDAVTANAQGLTAHLHNGAQQLFERRAAYAEEDILGWVDEQAANIAAGRARIEAMLSAAHDAPAIGGVVDELRAAGLSCAAPAPLTLMGRNLPAAWIVNARRG